jgi:hypothetical protein
MVSVNDISRIKKILREEDCPFFEDEDIAFYLNENGYDVNETLYQMFLIKAEDTSLNVSGLTCADTSKYFRRMAQRYRKSNSGTLKGG